MSPGEHREIYIDDEQISDYEFTEEEIIETVVDFLRLSKDSEKIVLTRDFDDLPQERKIAVVLLAHQFLRGGKPLEPTEIGDLAEEPIEALYPALRSLERKQLVENHNGLYHIPPRKVNNIRDLFQSAE